MRAHAEPLPSDPAAMRAALDAAIGPAVERGDVPGAVAIAGTADAACAPVGRGVRRLGGAAMTPDVRFDLASLSKVVGTLPGLLRLAGDGRLDLDAPLATWFPNAGWLREPSLADRTPRQLLTHTSGLPAWAPFMGLASHRRTVIGHALAAELPHAGDPGRPQVVYSDLGFIVAGALIERVSGQRQDAFLREATFGPLGLADDELGYRPLPGPDRPAPPKVPLAASEDCGWRMRLLEGEVHDEAAWIMGGVAGHAGLFGTAEALARYAQAWLRRDPRVASPELLDEAVRRATPAGQAARGLGWLLARDGEEGPAEPGGWRPARGFGHTGFTGTSLWIDPVAGTFCVLLSNAVHPSRHRRGALPALRRTVHAALFAMPEGESA